VALAARADNDEQSVFVDGRLPKDVHGRSDCRAEPRGRLTGIVGDSVENGLGCS
jgi:hypothetical protein